MDGLSELSRNLASNLEQLRKKRGLTQSALAALAGAPRSTIAHLESGRGNPSLDTLTRTASALRVPIEELLAAPRAESAVTRAKDIPTVERGQGSVRLQRLLADSLPGLQMERLDLRPGGFMRGVPHLRATKEYLTCLSGKMRVTVAGQDHLLAPGDVLAFPGDQPHAYHNPGRTPSVSISVVALAA